MASWKPNIIKHKQDEIQYIQKLRWDTKPHTFTLSFTQGWDPLMLFQSKKKKNLSPGSLKFMHLGLEWDHKKSGWNMKLMCIIVTLSFPTKPQQEAFMLAFIIYYFLQFTPPLPLLLPSHQLRRIFSMCLKLNVWPTHVFPDFLIQPRNKTHTHKKQHNKLSY